MASSQDVRVWRSFMVVSLLHSRWHRALAWLPAIFFLGFSAGGYSGRADEAADRLTLAVDALTRLEGINLEANPAMKERILQVLARTRGTANFVRLVRHFSLTGQEAGLLEVAAAMPRDESGVEAMRMILGGGRTEGLATALAVADGRARGLVEALGNSGQRTSVKFLRPLLDGGARGWTNGQEVVVRALARNEEGARSLLEVVKAGGLPEALRAVALDELSQVRWEPIKASASALRGPSASKWPALPELMRMPGDAGRGEGIFRRASPGCFNCHVVRGLGTDLGPNLSEIGSKLTKEALFQAILEPSAGISFGYEAFTLTLKDGDDVYGLIASETETEVSIKAVGGVVTRYKKSEIESRKKSALSLMPAGLEAGMTPPELVDLVTYLGALKKAE